MALWQVRRVPSMAEERDIAWLRYVARFGDPYIEMVGDETCSVNF